MLDPKYFKSSQNINKLKENLVARKYEIPSNFEETIYKRKEATVQLEDLQAQRNSYSKEIGILTSQQKLDEVKTLKEKMTSILKKMEEIKHQQEEVNKEYNSIMLNLPNLLAEDVPRGNSEEKNKIIFQNKEKPKLTFSPMPHYEIASKHNLIDFDRGAKISGSRFYVFNEDLAILERKLGNFLLQEHSKKNFKERSVPFIVSNECLVGTGQLPKFKGEFYEITSDNMSLIPTAEVSLTNLYANEILKEEDLPIYLMSLTPCFRREAGSAGRDTKGIIRVHQFQKVELVKFVKPEQSYLELDSLVQNVKDVLEAFNLTYRVVLLCSGDTGFSSAKTYDLEIWMPGMNRWLEISSCSNFLDFQSRRIKIRFKDMIQNKNEYLHTLNGSGVAIGRLIAALLEYYQKQDGSIDFKKIEQMLNN